MLETFMKLVKILIKISRALKCQFSFHFRRKYRIKFYKNQKVDHLNLINFHRFQLLVIKLKVTFKTNF